MRCFSSDNLRHAAYKNLLHRKSKDEINPAMVSKITANQRKDTILQRYLKKNVEVDPKDMIMISIKVIDNIDVLLYNSKRLVIPTSLQTNIVTWYHHYL